MQIFRLPWRFYSIQTQYKKAQDCFKAALAVRPNDWLLYNRVGATMANSSHPEEALAYYHRALELNPGYIRARFNWGISCMNLKRYDEAAQHILDALALQNSDGVQGSTTLNEKRGVVSSTLWDNLRTTCLHMQRPDLVALCDSKDLEGMLILLFVLHHFFSRFSSSRFPQLLPRDGGIMTGVTLNRWYTTWLFGSRPRVIQKTFWFQT